MRIGTISLAVLALGLAVSPALAQGYKYAPPYRGGVPASVLDDQPTPFSYGGSCVAACEGDYSPCDPDYWKVTDRRCNANQHRSKGR